VEKEVVWLLQPAFLVFSIQFGIAEKTKMLIENCGHVRGITKILETSLDPVRKLLDNGEEVRHIDLSHFSLNEPIAALWTDDATCARYLMSSFDAQWEQSAPAKERIKELRKQALRRSDSRAHQFFRFCIVPQKPVILP